MDAENLNNDMLPVGTAVHINPKDIKWEVSGDLISRKDIKDHISELLLVYSGAELANAILDAIDNAPAVDMSTELSVAYLKGRRQGQSEERPQGEWIHHEEYTNDRPFYITECPFCSLRVKEETNYCPNCGAEMRKGGTE